MNNTIFLNMDRPVSVNNTIVLDGKQILLDNISNFNTVLIIAYIGLLMVYLFTNNERMKYHLLLAGLTITFFSTIYYAIAKNDYFYLILILFQSMLIVPLTINIYRSSRERE